MTSRQGAPEMRGSAVVSRTVRAPASAVWQVLTDGWLYGTWVVGASRVRDVDASWPATNSRLHHSFGLWPLLIDDYSQVLASEPERTLVLRARGWPAGEATVELTLESISPERTEVRIVEDATAGPGRLVPKPLRQLMIRPRNVEALRRLALIAEGRHEHATAAAQV